MLIDWLTLRTKINDIQDNDLMSLMPYLAKLQVTNALTDEVIKMKLVVDIDAVRSDFQGMVWSVTSNGVDKYLNIGASPASLQFGSNLFGSFDYFYCKQILINHAKKVLSNVCLFNDDWLPRRIDVTQNYFMNSKYQVKDALLQLRTMDSIRQKATTKMDSVYWAISSHYRSGKAYDKGTQAIHLNKKAEKNNKPLIYTPEQLEQIQSILRLELKLGRQFFDEHQDESLLTPEFLTNEHNEFFSKFIGSAEVTDMDTLLKSLIEIAPTKGRALAAYSTFLRMKESGYYFTSETMPRSTFALHRKYLKAAGLSESDLLNAKFESEKVVHLRKRRIDLEPVMSWEHLNQLLRKAA